MPGDATPPFRFAYDGPTLRFGADAVTGLHTELDAAGAQRVLVVCGQTVGDTSAVIEPVRAGLGDRAHHLFAETTPAKRLATAIDARDAYRDHGADAIVAVGGGSSLDVAKVTRLLVADDRSPATIHEEFAATRTLTCPDAALPPLVVVPTTLAGADQSQGAGITAVSDTGDPIAGGVGDPRLMPTAACYDPALVATTPRSVLRGSAMNGFDKGIETLYASTATPITDATATHGLQFLADHLPALGDGPPSAATLAPIVQGLVLVQYGISRPTGTTLSIIHAFGHALTAAADLQQGIAHAVVAPHVLEYLFEAVPGRRHRLATALDVEDTDDDATAVVDRVTAIRDRMGLPTRLRDVDAPPRDGFPAVAQSVLDDSFMANAPPDLDPTVSDLVAVLEAAY